MKRWPKNRRHFRKDTYNGMRWNLGDFVLWHGYRGGDEVSWETGIGRGRPAWNIQDAAMATKFLGFRIDVSCGGIDNLYRHHDYTIAVAEGVSGKEFSRYWLHGEHLLVKGKKMSKSRGNVVYVDDLLRRGYGPEQIRFYLIYGHYRRSMSLTEDKLREAVKTLDDLREMVGELISARPSAIGPCEVADELVVTLKRRFEEHMNDDLDVKGAFDALLKAIQEIGSLGRGGGLGKDGREKIAQGLAEIDNVLQVIFPKGEAHGL